MTFSEIIITMCPKENPRLKRIEQTKALKFTRDNLSLYLLISK